MQKSHTHRAFTLIELLIVITIIGILAVALVPRLTGGPAKARDAQRKTDLQQIATALEFYADDNSGQYPTPASTSCVSDIKTSLTGYLTTIPSDPQAGGTVCTSGYTYIPITVSSKVTSYILMAKLENIKAAGTGIYEGSSWTPSSVTSYATQIGAKTTCTGACTTPVYVVGR